MKHQIKKNSTDVDKSSYIKELIIARIRTLSDNLEITIGNQSFSKEQIIESVEQNTKFGQEFTEMQLKFLRDISEGKIYDN